MVFIHTLDVWDLRRHGPPSDPQDNEQVTTVGDVLSLIEEGSSGLKDKVDQHIANDTDAHFGQDLKVTGHPTFDDIELSKDGFTSVSGALTTLDSKKASALDFDTHTGNSSDAHFGQNLTSTASPTFNDLKLTGYPSVTTTLGAKANSSDLTDLS